MSPGQSPAVYPMGGAPSARGPSDGLRSPGREGRLQRTLKRDGAGVRHTQRQESSSDPWLTEGRTVSIGTAAAGTKTPRRDEGSADPLHDHRCPSQ